MRLIDADALKERIGKICDESEEGYENGNDGTGFKECTIYRN